MLPSKQFSRAAIADQITTADRDLLVRRQVGRLGYASGTGHERVVVNYMIMDSHIVIRVPEYSEIAWYVPGTEVTLTVDGDQSATRGLCSCAGSPYRANAIRRRRIWTPEQSIGRKGIHVTVICLPWPSPGSPAGF